MNLDAELQLKHEIDLQEAARLDQIDQHNKLLLYDWKICPISIPFGLITYQSQFHLFLQISYHLASQISLKIKNIVQIVPHSSGQDLQIITVQVPDHLVPVVESSLINQSQIVTIIKPKSDLSSDIKQIAKFDLIRIETNNLLNHSISQTRINIPFGRKLRARD